MLNLRGKGALVIGVRRIGAVVAKRLAKEGVNLAVAYRTSKEESEELIDSVKCMVEKTHIIQGDVDREEDVKRMVASAREALGGLHFLVNLASGYPRRPLDLLDGAAWDEAMAPAKGSYLLAASAYKAMAQNPGPTRGHIIMFGDWAAMETPYRDYLPYLTSKAAVDFMGRAFALELAPHGILVNVIAPGPTLRHPDISEEEWRQDVLDLTPLHVESSAEEMAEMVVTLLKSETITGETIRVDSGRHIAGAGLRG